MGASMHEDTNEKSWMASSPKRLGKNGGDLTKGFHPSPSVDVQSPTHTLHE